jgi:hypothetical protein
MRDGRPVALLHFAIAASITVVPLLLVVLLVLGWVAPSERPRITGDSHVSVRQVAALKTFEHAIVRRDRVQAPLPDAAALLAQLPQCAAEWSRSGRERALDRVKRFVGRASGDALTPAASIASQLAELDDALARISAEGNRRVVDAVGFDVVRWSDAAKVALSTPIETSRYPGQAFGLHCADLAAAVATLSRGGGRVLAAFGWRGTEVDRTLARWRPDQYVEIPERYLERTNPWAGLPGCVFLVDPAGAPQYFVRGARAASERVCTQPAVFDAAGGDSGAATPSSIVGEPTPDIAPDDPRWSVPPSLSALLRPLEPLQRPTGALFRAYAAGSPPGESPGYRRTSNRVAVDGGGVDVGFSVDLTIDPALQSLAQKTAACYTGRQDVCRALGLRRVEDGNDAIGHRLLEHAMVRMAAIAIIDVKTGRIETLAGALSRCTRQEYDGPGRDAGCDARLPYPIRYRPDALLNAAVFHDAMPASVVKPVMAAAFLANARVGSPWLAAERSAMRSNGVPTADSLRGQLMRSMSARFLDRMFCADQGFKPCERPWEIQRVSEAIGWNGGCAQPSERCGDRDLLFGRPIDDADSSHDDALASWVPYGRLMVEPVGDKLGAAFHVRAPLALDTNRIARCAAGADGHRGTGDDWEKCSGGVVVDVVAEGWGQGHARSTALGAAGMMATLASAANGQSDVKRPHLVQSVRGVANGVASPLDAAVTRWRAASTEPSPLSRDAAEVILSGLSYSHRYGTARRACEQVFDAHRCVEIDWIAGKTGTPTFPNDDRSLDELVKLCAPGVKRTASEQTACGGLRPYKWYVAAYRTDRDDPAWTKVIGVLTERNWLADSGRVHGAGDRGPNPAAEIALQIIGRHTAALGGPK